MCLPTKTCDGIDSLIIQILILNIRMPTGRGEMDLGHAAVPISTSTRNEYEYCH